MKLSFTISGDWPDDLDPEEIDSLKEELEGEARYSGGKGVMVEAEQIG